MRWQGRLFFQANGDTPKPGYVLRRTYLPQTYPASVPQGRLTPDGGIGRE